MISQKSSEEEMVALWTEYKRHGLTVRELRKQEKSPPKQRWYEFRFVPDGKDFSLKIKFRKTRVEPPEIRAALEKALARLKQIETGTEE